MNSDAELPDDVDDSEERAGVPDPYATTEGESADNSLLNTLSPFEIDSLEHVLEGFAQHAPVADPRELVNYLPVESSIEVKFVLAELIKLDMAAAAEAGAVPRIERYLDAMPDLITTDDVPIDLVMEELQLRREAGEKPSREEYDRRFPRVGTVFGHLLSAASSPLELDVGSTIDDFLIIQTLGAGAFAKVYLARQISIQRLVALKVSKGTGAESQALAKFDHPNVVRVFDQRNLDDRQLHLLYMQYSPGGTLADVIKSLRGHDITARDGQLLLDAIDRQLLRAAQAVPERSTVRLWLSSADWPIVVAWIGVQLARALDDAHRNKIFHRDVKPANVLLSAEGIPKLADFNVSGTEAGDRSGESTFGGSIGYMAPEHLRAIDAESPGSPEDVRAHADLYSLGILLWELWQGGRPFDCGTASSKQDAFRGQLDARMRPLLEPQRGGSASERVLEKTLRKALSPEPDDRPSSGAEFAGRLKLALHPEAAGIFDPDADSMRVWLMKRSPWVLAGFAIMLPNIAVGIFNFWFNRLALDDLETNKQAIQSFHRMISHGFNTVAFPLGFIVALWRILPMIRAIKASQRGEKSTSEGISATLNLGQHAALIGGGFWTVAAVFYTVVLMLKFDDFGVFEGSQIFISHLVCGGIAATYPFFGLATLATMVYYPRLVRGTMQDPEFDQRLQQSITRSEIWLWVGAGVPLLGAALLSMHADDHRWFLFAMVIFSAAGLVASFLAYKNLTRYWDRMSEVLSTQRSSVVPGAAEED